MGIAIATMGGASAPIIFRLNATRHSSQRAAGSFAFQKYVRCIKPTAGLQMHPFPSHGTSGGAVSTSFSGLSNCKSGERLSEIADTSDGSARSL